MKKTTKLINNLTSFLAKRTQGCYNPRRVQTKIIWTVLDEAKVLLRQLLGDKVDLDLNIVLTAGSILAALFRFSAFCSVHG
jgi:hypothetical protein